MKMPFAPVALAAALACGAAHAEPAVVKIAYIDPLSGPFANIGQLMLSNIQYAVQDINAKGGVLKGTAKLELLQFDSKLSVTESQGALQSAIDQGARAIVTGGSGSTVVTALVHAAARHNERNPDKAILILNHSSIDPDLTGKGCNFWYFQFEANTAMKMKAIANYIKKQGDIHNVYLFNQDYAHGRQWSRYGRELVGLARPDVKFVGDDFHPVGRVKDFAPYVAKIKASGADTVITGNWGQDLTLLVKAMNDAGLKIPMYTYYAGVTGTPTALAAGGDSEVYVVAYGHANHTGDLGQMGAEFHKKFNDDYYTYATYNGINLLSAAMAKAQSTNPVKVAKAMEGLSVKSFAGDVTMRASDHQLQQTMFIAKWQKATPKGEYSVENTGYNFQPVKAYDAYVASTPTSCQMKRP